MLRVNHLSPLWPGVRTVIHEEQRLCLEKETQASAEGGVTAIPEQFLSTLLWMHVYAASQVLDRHHAKERNERQVSANIWDSSDVY